MIEIKHRAFGTVQHTVDADTLSHADLSDIDLRDVNLSGANLSGANLRNTKLDNAVLDHADLTGADLSGASMRGAILVHATLFRADLRGATLSGAPLMNANFFLAHLTDANLSGAALQDTEFVNCPTLHQAKGLELVRHIGPSILDPRTLRACVNHLPDVFLQGVGYSQQEIETLRSLYVAEEKQPAETNRNKAEIQPRREGTKNMALDIFISHSSKDKEVAKALIDVLRQAYNLSATKIRCTSVDGYKLDVGANTNETIKAEVREARAFIGLITPISIDSLYVLFELGARWGADLHLVPLLASGAEPSLLRPPLSDSNVLNCSNAGDIFQFVANIAKVLGSEVETPNVYHQAVAHLVEVSKQAGVNYQEEKAANPS